jgi:hypothetical protein
MTRIWMQLPTPAPPTASPASTASRATCHCVGHVPVPLTWPLGPLWSPPALLFSACREDNYFFRLSRYAPQIEDMLAGEQGFVEPVARRNEVRGLKSAVCAHAGGLLVPPCSLLPLPEQHAPCVPSCAPCSCWPWSRTGCVTSPSRAPL